jgi:murein DD-endopeptidase MepM/ murein hydrolase activator NlpD
MTVETASLGSRFFPEIRICFGSSGAIRVSPRLLALLLWTTLAGTGLFVYLGVSRIGYQHLAEKMEVAAVRARAAGAELEKRLNWLQQHFVAAVQQRDRAQAAAAAQSEQMLALRNRLTEMEAKRHSLDQAETGLGELERNIARLATAPFAAAGSTPEPLSPPAQPFATAAPDSTSESTVSAEQALAQQQALAAARQELRQERAHSSALAAQLEQIESERAAEKAQLAQYKASLEETARQLAQLSALGNKITVKRGRVHLQLDEIWRKLSQIRLGLPASAAGSIMQAEGRTGAAPPSGGIAAGNGAAAPNAVAAFESTLRSAGVDVDRVVAQLSNGHAEGGPFVPPRPDPATPNGGLEKLAAFEALVRTLPIAAPLARYEVGSRFGERTDPFNRRPGFHTGIDMDAPYSSPVYATAPGTVIYSGWLGDYGKVVEIDHGFGIVTLYAHLRREFVAVGQTVPAQAEIGLVGSTGRSTGPHVHYEVRVNGEPEDPEKFLGLARLLPLATASRQLSPAAGEPAANSR